jgi:hypothetical protein
VPHSNKFLLTVHGVNSTNDGFAALRDRCEHNLQGLLVDSYFYGKVLPFKELTGSLRQFIFRALRDQLELITRNHLIPETRKCFIVAHSFGTLAVVRALEMHVPNLKVDGLILLGSIVPRDYYWDGLVRSECLAQPPLAIVRPCDRVVRTARVVGGDSSGSDGFIPTGIHRPLEVFKNGGHTAYDPHDVSDVITAIRGGLTAVTLKDRVTWLGEQSRLKRIWH